MNTKKLLFFLTLFLVFFLGPNTSALAEQTSFLDVKVETDKEEYNENEEITYKITLTNASESTAKDVAVTTVLPEGLEVVSKDVTVQDNKINWNIEKINPTDKVELQFSAKVKNADGTAPPIKPGVEENGAPQTGDSTSFVGYFLLLLFSSIVVFTAIKALRKKRLPKEVTFMLILALLLPSFSVAHAEEPEPDLQKEKVTIENSHKLYIGGNEYVVKTTVTALIQLGELEASEIPVSGTAFVNEDELLENQTLTFTANGIDDVIKVQTDENGYFVVRLQKGITYTVTGEGISATLTANKANDIDLSNKKGHLELGLTITIDENESVIQPSTIVITDEEVERISEVEDDFSKIVFDGEVELNRGEVFLFPVFEGYPDGQPAIVAAKVIDVTKKDGQTILTTVEPELDEVFRSIKGDTVTELYCCEFVPGEGVVVEEGVIIEDGIPTPLEEITSISLDNLFDGNSPVTASEGTSLDFSGKIRASIDWTAGQDFDDAWTFRFEGSQVIKGTFKVDSSTPGSTELKLGKYHVMTDIPGLFFTVPVDLVVQYGDGKAMVEVAAGVNEEIEVAYNEGNDPNVNPEANFSPEFDMYHAEGSGKISLGVKISALAQPLFIDMAGFSGEGGITSELKKDSDDFFSSTQVSPAFYAAFSAEAPLHNWSYIFDVISEELENREFLGSYEIEANPSVMNIAPGETLELVVKAINGFGEDEVVSGLDYNNYEVLESEDIIVEKNSETNKAYIVASENAESGETAKINVTLSICDIDFSTTVTVNVVRESAKGTLIGKIVDAEGDTPISGATVTIFDGDNQVTETTTNENGTYQVLLLPGEYNVVITHPDYLKISSKINIIRTDSTTHGPQLKMVNASHSEIGTATGTITHASTGNGVPGLTINIRQGHDNLTGAIDKIITTDQQGNYSVDLEGGYYTLEIKGDGFITTSANIVVLGGDLKDGQNATIVPDGLLGDQLRIVLNWGADPWDLDSHLTGPTADGERFHVYHGSTEYSDEENDIRLDVDDMDSHGPETVTVIKHLNEGTYKYVIHDYSNRYAKNSMLSNSSATVSIYSGTALLQTYNVPIDREGNVWKVFEIRDGEIVPINTIEFDDSFDSPDDSGLPPGV